MSDNLLLLFQETVVGTYSDSDTTIEISSVSRLVDQLPLNLNLYDRNYGTAVDAFKAGFFEVIRVESLNVGDNEIVGLRGQEGTTPLTIGAGNWVVYQAINPKTISDKEDSFEKNTAFNKDFGTGEGTVAEGNDTRLLNNVKKTSDTGSAILPKGTEAQRDAEPTAGYLRFNEDENEFEGYNGTEWGKIGGGADVSLYNPITRIVETVTDTVDIGTAITKAFVFRNGAFVLPSEYIFDGDDLIFTEYDLDGTETAEEIVVYPITAEPLSVGIADNLTTDDPNQALSAKQGKVLEDNKVDTSAIVNDLTTGGASVPASAETVKVLNERFEIGTWTPVYEAFTGSFGSITYGTRVGTYVKIGDMVHVSFRIQTESLSVGTAADIVGVGGLPFPILDVENGRNSGSVGLSAGFSSNHPTSLFGNAGSSRVFFQTRSSAGGASINVPPSSMNTGSGSNLIFATITYRIEP